MKRITLFQQIANWTSWLVSSIKIVGQDKYIIDWRCSITVTKFCFVAFLGGQYMKHIFIWFTFVMSIYIPFIEIAIGESMLFLWILTFHGYSAYGLHRSVKNIQYTIACQILKTLVSQSARISTFFKNKSSFRSCIWFFLKSDSYESI